MANQIRYQVGFDIQQNNLNQLKSSLQQLQKMKISDIMKINDSDAASATSALYKIKEQAEKVQDALKQAFNTKLNTVNIETFNQSLRQSGSSIEQVYQAFKAAGTSGEVAFRNLSSHVLSTNIQLKETHNILDKMATTLTNTVKWNLASGAVNILTRSVEQAWGYVKSLDTSLNNIRVVTGKSASEMANFAIQANNAAKELGKTTTDYTNAALIFAQQGLNDKEIQERAAITLKTANVTGQSTDAVSEQLTAVWNGYKVNAEEAELYVDRLAAVAATTASDLQELSTGMSKVASAAAAMGVGEDQLAAQLSTIISVTKQAPESVGTALRTVYARISDIKAGIDEDGVTLGNYSGKMAELGFNVLDATGHLRDMGEVMEEIGGRWEDLTREQQVNLAQTMAGQRQYNNLLALFDNFEEYNKALNTAQNAAGTLQEQQDIYMESTAAHLQQLKASVEDVYDSLIDTDSINGLVDGLSSAATFTANLVDSLGGGGAVLRSLGAIGVTVFSEQIAKGLNTTITNLEIGKENARQFDQALQATKDWQGIPGLDEISQELLRDREQLLELSRLMNPEQFTGMQKLLNDITQVGNELASLNDKQGFLKEATKEVLAAEDQWKSFNDILKDESGQKAVIDRVQKQEDAFKQVRDALNKYLNDLKNLRQQSLKGDNISSQLAESRQELIRYADELQKMVDKGQLQRHGEEVTKLRQKLDGLDDSLPAQQIAAKLQLIGGQLRGIASNASNVATDLRTNLENEFAQTAESLGTQIDTINQRLQKMKAQFDSEINKASRAVTIENYAKIAGGIASVGNSIQQLQNIGSIWKNEDLKTGQKVLQTVTNLTISLPMLITGVTKTATALKVLALAQYENSAAAAAALTANNAHAVSLGALGIAVDGATVKLQLFNTVVSLNPFAIAAAALGGLTLAYLAHADAVEKARKAKLEQAQQTIEEQNQIQKQIESHQSLYESLQKLYKQNQDHTLSRGQLKSAVEDLIEQYGLEGQAVNTLTGNYKNLRTAIQDLKSQDINELQESTNRELTAASDAVIQQFKGTTEKRAGASLNQNEGRLYFGGGDIYQQDMQNLLNLMGLRSLGGAMKVFGDIANNGDTNRFLEIGQDVDLDKILETYDFLSSIIEQTKDPESIFNTGQFSMTGEQFRLSSYGQQIQAFLEYMRPVIDQYRQVSQAAEQVNANGAILEAENNLKTSFANVDSLNEYTNLRGQTIIEAHKNNPDIKASDVDQYIKSYYPQIYDQFSQKSELISQLMGRHFKDVLKSEIQQGLDALDPNQFNALRDLVELYPSTIQSWEDFEKLLSSIASMDFSNVKQATSEPDLQAAAADKYNIYQSLEDQISGGKTISSKELERLEPEVQEFFSMMANGSYKMTGDAKLFYATVNELKLDGFLQAIDSINNQIDLLQQGFNYDELNQSAYKQGTYFGTPSGKATSVDYNLVNEQLDYLSAVTDSDDALSLLIEDWRVLAENTALNKDIVEDIAKAVADVGDQTKNFDGTVEELKEKAEEVEHQLHDAMFPTDADIDTTVLETLSETIQDIADESDELADGLSEDARAAQGVAESILRFDNAIEDVVKNYDNWMAALNSGSIQEQAEVIDGLRDAYADLLDLDGSSLSEDFLTNTENLDLMKAAIDGDIDAYNELLSVAQQDIIAHLQLSEEDYNQFVSEINNVQAMMDEMNFQDIEIGASLDDTNFIAGLENMINAAGMTAQQATDYLASMGVDAEVIQQKSQGTETKTQTGWNATLVPHTEWGQVPIISGQGTNVTTSSIKVPYTVYDSNYVPKTETVTDTKENAAFSLKVTSAHKSSGGNFKFTQAKNGGGSAGTTRRAPSSSGKGNGGKGGKGNGGSGKGTQPDTSQKDLKKALEDERDIYHDINIELQQINRQLDRTQKKQDRLYGKQLIDNLNKQSKILSDQNSKLKEKQGLQEWDLKRQQETLKNLGVTFDKYGNISNYMSVLAQKQAEINQKTEEYNNLIKLYNESTDKDVKKAIAEEAEAINKQLKNADDDYKKLEKKIKDYDGLREDMEDLVDDMDEITQQEIEIRIKKFRMEVEIRLDMGEAARDWNKFRREVLEHTDIVKDTDFQKIFRDALQSRRDAQSYFNVQGSKGSIETLTEKLMDTYAEIEKIDKTGESAIYGDNKAKAMEDLQNDLKELMSQMEDIQQLIDDIDQAYFDTIEDVEKQFNKQIEDYEYVGELIEHDIDLLTLLYGDRNYDAINRYYETLERNSLKQLDSLKKQRDFWKEQWDAAVAQGDTKAAEQFEKNYKNVIKNLNSTVQQAAENLQNKWVNAINKIFDELDKKISNGKGTDYLSMEWQLMNKNADEYLDTINSAFAIQETQRKYQKALDETKSIKNQQALKKLMDEQLNILKNREKLTQYDIDRAEKMLQIEQARIALQEAQSAKTSMRLKRDSQGNYSYEYVADKGAIEDAEADLAKAQNDLYNFDKERYRANLNDMLSAWKDFQAKYKEIVLDTSLSEQERIERLALLRQQYGEYINGKTEQNLNIRQNLMESAFQDLAALYKTDVSNYEQMSEDEKNIIMEDLVPAWGSGVQQMSDKIAGQGGFVSACKEAFEEAETTTKSYEEELEKMAETAGVNLSDVRQGVDEVAEAVSDAIEDNDELIRKMADEVESIHTLRTQAQLLAADYKTVYESAKQAVTVIYQFIQAQKDLWALYAGGASGSGGTSSSTAYGGGSTTSSKSTTGSTPSSSGANGTGGSGSGSGSSGSGSSGTGGSQTTTTTTTTTTVVKRGSGGARPNLMAAFDNGGYTGSWNDTNGKMAILHEKELVLDQKDTKNILDSVKILRSFSGLIQTDLFNRFGVSNQQSIFSNNSSEQMEQNVHIEASFPNVDSKKEIEEAFNDLINLAAQRVMRR